MLDTIDYFVMTNLLMEEDGAPRENKQAVNSGQSILDCMIYWLHIVSLISHFINFYIFYRKILTSSRVVLPFYTLKYLYFIWFPNFGLVFMMTPPPLPQKKTKEKTKEKTYNKHIHHSVKLGWLVVAMHSAIKTNALKQLFWYV